MSKIHPTALISPEAVLADDVEIGAYCSIEGPVKLGPGCVMRAHARLTGPLTMGARNIVYTGANIGDWPQDRKYKGEPSETIIGEDNVFREYVTVHRGTGANTKTVVGHRNYFMVSTHVGHNCVVGNDITMVNNAVIAGHVHLGDRCIIGSFCGVHQFCHIGTLSMLSHNTVATVDVPPYLISLTTNHVTQLNGVGLRRSGMSKEALIAVRRMFKHVYRTEGGRPLAVALASLPEELRAFPEVRVFLDFCQNSKRGLARFQRWSERGTQEALPDIAETGAEE